MIQPETTRVVMSTQEHLRGLYPSLHGRRQDPRALRTTLLESIRQKAAHHRDALDTFIAESSEELLATALTLAGVYRRSGRLFTMGNGGSSCDAAHLAVEFLHPVTAGRPALQATNLTSDVAMMTAVANDIGFAEVFGRQLVAQARAGDCLIGISTSGNSNNLLQAFVKATELELKTIGLCGGDGGAMASAGLDHCLVVRTDSIHRVQECHVAIYHILWDLVHTLLADDRQALSDQARTRGDGGVP
jgi:D-sedoheptulose 7-phosphate isomerase